MAGALDKRGLLVPLETGWLQGTDRQFENAAKRLLRILNGYFFGEVDVDVWRNVYQHYLPDDERQRIGGFYTPDEIIDLVLDLAEFSPEAEGLCRLLFVDPACGSGAFVTNALARLLRHLDLDLPCHAELRRRGVPEWKRRRKAQPDFAELARGGLAPICGVSDHRECALSC